MPRPSKRSRIAKNLNRVASTGAFAKKIKSTNEELVDLYEIDYEDDIILNDRELQRMTENVTLAGFTIGTHSTTMDESAQSSKKDVKVSSIDKLTLVKLAYEDVTKNLVPFTRPASERASMEVWVNANTYRLAMIRKYAKEYLDFWSIALHQQGKHARRPSLFSDEDFKTTICKWIQQQRPESRSAILVKKNIDEIVVPEKLGIPGNVLTSMIWKYLHKWGYIFRKNSKDIYYDTKMASFGTNSDVTMPQLSTDEVEHVLVTHDESTFYSNDGKEAMWLVEDENPIRKKGPDMSLMISEFRYACHDTMLDSNTISLFALLHPECKAVFVFGQSTNHKAYSQNALIVNKINLDDKEVEEDDPCVLRETIFAQDGVEKKVKYMKGVCTILEECGMWLEKDPYNLRKKWKLDCKSKDASEGSKCCAHHFLTSQPDFLSQKTVLHEAIEGSGHLFELYLKFYCDCNWIERYRGAAKHEARLQCNYIYKSHYIEAYSQKMNVKEAHEAVKQFTSRKYTSCCRDEGKD
ncbi:hypothetical protein PHYBLDRAFT_145045 [Phycomyces blakesleeanus NRRL 1555(-)]|uniref:Uncharacterized protein n=1 Tax=Phycomyces blakesleeanus (strain ATCC 8743b / DSM 1359 / FGSC 10004 / NBRC 33097 / NRRL 1555) TaxID=763407 RepID=A0A162UEU0_PHYB8|nr:hypothetical protein PHYBLDRAFT_145045 [Phycomyces blakesleeanus NRRL 1555(-)]OAD74613.1 hypothetical protein PHYBLDRAFT_145045 [Phycomyces blakesleeanus NRRL 1555(-)]|eukprot:XP_018292653.1 hypothetical protein PHYBLDRAFT_145045 [Phycomyces blakesleeanus NRRL 1555(-)]